MDSIQVDNRTIITSQTATRTGQSLGSGDDYRDQNNRHVHNQFDEETAVDEATQQSYEAAAKGYDEALPTSANPSNPHRALILPLMHPTLAENNHDQAYALPPQSPILQQTFANHVIPIGGPNPLPMTPDILALMGLPPNRGWQMGVSPRDQPAASPFLTISATPKVGFAPFLSPLMKPSDWTNSQFLQTISGMPNASAGFLSPLGHPLSPQMQPLMQEQPELTWADYATNVMPGTPSIAAVPSRIPCEGLNDFGAPPSAHSVCPPSLMITPTDGMQYGGGTERSPSNFQPQTMHNPPRFQPNMTQKQVDKESENNSPPHMVEDQMGGGVSNQHQASNGMLFLLDAPPSSNGAGLYGGEWNGFVSNQAGLVGNGWKQGSMENVPQAFDERFVDWDGKKLDGSLVDTVLHAKSLIEQMLNEFSVERASQVLSVASTLLGRSRPAIADLPQLPLTGGTTSLPSVKLVHPDEFKNPSTFLQIYGDPLCFTKNGSLPKKGRNGNWECSKCSNVNFPRRFRCNMCSTTRDEEGDWVVCDYARQVYERYLFIYKNQQRPNAAGGSPGGNSGLPGTNAEGGPMLSKNQVAGSSGMENSPNRAGAGAGVQHGTAGNPSLFGFPALGNAGGSLGVHKTQTNLGHASGGSSARSPHNQRRHQEASAHYTYADVVASNLADSVEQQGGARMTMSTNLRAPMNGCSTAKIPHPPPPVVANPGSAGQPKFTAL